MPDTEGPSNVIPFEPPRRAIVPVVRYGGECDGCPDDCGRPCDVAKPSHEPDMEDLVFIAERFMRTQLAHINWRDIGMKNAAGFFLDESDAESVVRIAESARIEVYFDGA